MMPYSRPGHLETLERERCLDLVATASVGRLAYNRGGILGVIPVNICLDHEDVYFRLGIGAALRSIYDRDLITLETDQFDIEQETGWSVNIVGVPREVPQVPPHTSRHHVHSWVRPDAGRLFVLASDKLSGRRIPETS